MGIINKGFSGSIQRRCSECGKILGPLDKIHSNGAKDVCDACYQRLKATSRNTQSKKEQSFLELLEIIKKSFGVSQVPKKLLYQIDRIIENDPKKNYANIGYTINYAFSRMGVLDPEGGVAGIIGYFYEDAAKHYAKAKEVFIHNSSFVPSESTVVVKLPQPDPDAPVFKPKTNINNL